MEIKLNSSKIDFKIDGRKIFQNLFDFNLGSVATEILDINSNIESKAFDLLYNVTKQTNTELAKKLDQSKLDEAKDLIVIFQNLEYEWKKYFEEEIVLTKEFFENALGFNPDYLICSYQLFEKYLNILEIEVPQNFYYNYYLTFRENLSYEFQNNKEKYGELVTYFDNPVYEQSSKLESQISHYLDIGSYYTNALQSNFDSGIETLKDLYIEPNFTIYKQNIKEQIDRNDHFIALPEPLSIHSFLNDYFLKDKIFSICRENYNMIFVLGQPGQGKTSFCYKLVYDILENSLGFPKSPLCFIKIRDLNARDFIDKTFDTINNAICQDFDFTKDSCVLILDGLDEAYMSGGLTNVDLKNLYGRLNKASKHNKKLKIVLTSRLNYLDVNDPSIEETLVVKLDNLNDDQIIQYVDKFKGFHPENLLIKKVDLFLYKSEFIHIKELLQQPVLMYFIALSNIDIEEKDSKSNIYGKIFDSLAERSWDNNGQLHYIRPELKAKPEKYSKYLRQYIRNIAFEIYQSPKLFISIKNLLELEATNQFIKQCFNEDIENESDRIKEISKYLLISFYFQQSNKNQEEDTAIEFFHNSLWEFLTAEFIWEENKRIALNFDEDGDLKAITAEEYFNILKKLTGNKFINNEIVKNLENIIANENLETQKQVMKQTENVFYKLVDKDILLTYDWKSEQLTAKEKSAQIFNLMWTFIRALNDGLNSTINSTTKLNSLIFSVGSGFGYQENIKNIEFNELCFEHQHFMECKIKNVVFNMKLHVKLNLNDNLIEDTLFGTLHLNAYMQGNEFKNVTFQNINLSDVEFLNNKFIECKFLNVQFDNKDVFDEILNNNEFDNNFLESHKLLAHTANLNDEEIVFYILDHV
jgi:hypothetical protein